MAISTVVNDSMITDMTDSQGRYTLVVPLDGEDWVMVDVHAYKPTYIPADSLNRVVRFQQIDTLDFELRCEAGPIYGTITDVYFEEPVGNVHVYIQGDPTKSTDSEPDGSYSLTVWDEDDYRICFEHPDFIIEYRDTATVCYQRYEVDVEMEQVIWHVATWGSDDTGNGRWSNPFATIQKGIDCASTDDTVLVMPGIYTGSGNRDININGQQITIRSEQGPEQTIIDCGGAPGDQHRAFTFENMDALTILEGFTIKHGFNTSGGAINCSPSGSPTILNCILKENTAEDYGGAIRINRESNPTIRHCVIMYNDADLGAGIAIQNGSFATIDSCVIRDNTASYDGGGVYSDESFPLLRNCTLTRNSAGLYSDGGGIYCADNGGQTAEIRRCILWYNEPDQIYAVDTDPIVDSCDVQGGWPGIGNKNEHPLFCNPVEDDFHLAENSPCYDYPPISPENIGALGMGCDSLSIIYGWVTDMATLDSIEEVSVEANCYNSSPIGTATTDSDGYYELLIISSCTDTADVTFSHPSYQNITVDSTVFDPGYSTQLDVAMEPGGCDYIPGDCNHNGVPLQLGDVIDMIGMYRGTVEAPYICDCPDVGLFAATADPNGNCIAFELADVTQEICAYRGTCVAYGCCICPGDGPPPPDPAGACCIDLICEFTSQEQPCLDAGGTWYCGQTCPEFECPTVVAPPAGASAVPSLKSKARIDRNGLTQ